MGLRSENQEVCQTAAKQLLTRINASVYIYRYHRVKWEEEQHIAEFTPINTQEELDGIIASRLKRERETIGKQYQTQLEERDSKIAGFETQVTDLNKQIESLSAQAGKVPEMEARIREYETSSVKMRIARETGLPAELADRLTGGDEAAMRADAEGLAKLLSQNQPVAPMYHPGSEGGNGSAKEQAMKNLLDNIRPN